MVAITVKKELPPVCRSNRHPHQNLVHPDQLEEYSGVFYCEMRPIRVENRQGGRASHTIPFNLAITQPDMTESEELNNDDQPSANPQYALTEDGVLKVYSVGKTTVLGFGGEDVPSEFNAALYRAAISDLLVANNSDTVAFDLTGVQLVPSGMLGLLVSLKQLNGLEPVVQVFNPCEDVQEVLRITKLNTMIEVHEVDV